MLDSIVYGSRYVVHAVSVRHVRVLCRIETAKDSIDTAIVAIWNANRKPYPIFRIVKSLMTVSKPC